VRYALRISPDAKPRQRAEVRCRILRKIPVSRDCEGVGRPLTSANQFGHGGISAWVAIAVFALSQVATQAQAQSTTGDSGSRVEHQVSPRTLSRLLLIAATSAGN